MVIEIGIAPIVQYSKMLNNIIKSEWSIKLA